jgi:D-hydroxyproline dehydrogenase subunit alpha
VGAGLTGLHCAAALAPTAGTVVVDRIPAVGGVHGWYAPETRRAERAARAAGAAIHLGETAIRWDGQELLVMGPGGARRIGASALVIATGARPLGRAELMLAGDRPAGVLPATVACHLSESGLLVGRRPVVIGGGDWAARAVGRLLDAGADAVRVVAPDGLLRALPGSRRVRTSQGSAAALEGSPRVEALHLAGGERIACDAVVLAHRLAPLRNVDGAVWEGPRTVYAQPLADPMTAVAAAAAGRAAAAAVLDAIARRDAA